MPLLADLFSSSTNGVFAVDADERVVFWNEACEKQLGISAQAAMGRACHEVVRACTPSGLPFCRPGCCMARLAGGGSPPPALNLYFCLGKGKLRKLAVCTVLVPSQRKNLWSVAHILCREGDVKDCEALERSVQQQLQKPQENGDLKLPLPAPVTVPLTAREQSVLRLLAEGHAASVISKKLCISHVTARNHIQNLIGKLGLHSQLEAVAYAHRNNLV